MKSFNKFLKQIKQYPSAIFGVIVVALLIALAIYAMVAIPYGKAVSNWQNLEAWYLNPKYAAPSWVNWFTKKKQPLSFFGSTTDGTIQKEIIINEKDPNISTIEMTYSFDYQYDAVPQDLILYFTPKFPSKNPNVSIQMVTPDGREIRIADKGLKEKETFRFSQDERLQKRLKTDNVITALFTDPESETQAVVKGIYTLNMSGLTFEKGSDIDVELVGHGTVYGIAGTDNYRRDLLIPLLWGAPIALAFGLIASVGTSVLTLLIAAIGAWYGKWVDALIQRITEINMVLPFLSILIMIGTFYSRSIWVILTATILLSIFTGAIKGYRANFIQIKESTYVEAARSYGASDFRIVFKYLIPRMIPLLIPSLVSAVPAFVFLEASLAVLGLGDPTLPTWGKTINDAFQNGALYKGYYYWILEPAVLLMITGLGFAMFGYALDRIFNPRLREQ